MDNEIRREIRQLLPALRSLASSTDRAVSMDSYGAMGNMSVKSYRSLHGRLIQLLPGDVYITDALALEVDDNADDEGKVRQVNLAVNQLVEYLEAQIRNLTHDMPGRPPRPPRPPQPGMPPPPDMPEPPEPPEPLDPYDFAS